MKARHLVPKRMIFQKIFKDLVKSQHHVDGLSSRASMTKFKAEITRIRYFMQTTFGCSNPPLPANPNCPALKFGNNPPDQISPLPDRDKPSSPNEHTCWIFPIQELLEKLPGAREAKIKVIWTVIIEIMLPALAYSLVLGKVGLRRINVFVDATFSSKPAISISINPRLTGQLTCAGAPQEAPAFKTWENAL